MEVHLLSMYKLEQTTNTKNILDHCKMTISQLKYLLMLIITPIIQTVLKLPL